MFEDVGFDGAYDAMLTCMNGHLINDSFSGSPELNRRFCDRCGAATISACPSCNDPIPGRLRDSGGYVYDDDDVRAFCGHCGKPYPWTARKIHSAKAMADEVDGLSDAERLTIKSSIDDIVADTPMTQVGVIRLKKLIPKIIAGGGEALRKLLVDIASDTASKALKGQ